MIEEIVSYIKQKRVVNKNYIVGIDGGTGGGKTTVSNKIEQLLLDLDINVITLHIDDFINKVNVRYNDNYEEWYCFYYLQWRYKYLVDEILFPIKNNKRVKKSIEIYNKQDDDYDMIQIDITQGTVVLLEGIFLQREELKGMFDLIIYINVDRNERLKRVVKRDTYIGNEKQIIDKYERRYFAAEDCYVNQCKPIENADYIYNNIKS